MNLFVKPEVKVQIAKSLLARARWLYKSFVTCPTCEVAVRKYKSAAAITAYWRAFKYIQPMMFEQYGSQKGFDTYLAGLQPLTLAAHRADYLWWCSRERGKRYEVILKEANATLDALRVAASYIVKAAEGLGARLE